MRAVSVGVSSLFPDPVHTCHVHVMLHLLTSARIAVDPFFYLSQKLVRQFMKITSQTGCYTCIDEGGVYCVAYSTIRFLFFSFSFSALQLQRSGWEGALMNRCTPRRCWSAPTLPHVTLFATRSFPTFVGEGARRTQMRWRRGGKGRYSRSPGAREFVTGKKRR